MCSGKLEKGAGCVCLPVLSVAALCLQMFLMLVEENQGYIMAAAHSLARLRTIFTFEGSGPVRMFDGLTSAGYQRCV